MLDKIQKELKNQLQGFTLVKPMYDIDGFKIAWFSNSRINMYIITDGKNILDIQVD